MPVYHGKLIELESIEKKHDKYYLHIRLSFEKDIEIFWEIDEYTADNLIIATKSDEKYRYRLSFNNSWNGIENQHMSILTRTYCEESDRVNFSCSEDYINNLIAIKNIQHIEDVDKLDFISMNLTSIDIEEQEDCKNQYEENTFKKHINKFTWVSIATMSALFIILFSHLNRVYPSKASFDEKVLAQSLQLDNEIIKIKDNIPNENLDLKINKLVKDISSDEHILPFIELEKTISYGIPDGNVALTFDDGPSKYSTEIMDVLKEYGVGGTFFFTGKNVEKYPDHVQYIKSNGYSIGSHSMTHADMSTISYERQKFELIESIKLLEEVINEEIILFRPPYGSINDNIKDLVKENEYKMVLWNNDPEDWKARDADKIFNNIQNSNVLGSIILLHESQAVVDALPQIIEYLHELDLKIVNLE